MDDTDLGHYVCKRNDVLKTERAVWDSFWQDIANYVMPRKATITEHQLSPDTSQTSRLFDTTAVSANQTLGNGMLSLITPIEDRWWQWVPPEEIRGIQSAEEWYSECTRIAQGDLIRSNFYISQHEFALDRGGFGTASLFVERGKTNPFNFRNHEVGSFSIAENSEGKVDVYYREYQMTLRQVAQEFGIEAMSAKSLRMLMESKHNPSRSTEKITVIHAIEPRTDRDPRSANAKDMLFMSVWCEQEAKHVLYEGGFTKMPALVSRFLQWDHRQGPYGWCPSWFALPESRQLNLLQQWADALTELKVFPRFLIPSGMEGKIDLSAGGFTEFDPNLTNGARPEEWMTAGDDRTLGDRILTKKEIIEEHFFVPMFTMFARLAASKGSPPTATQIAEMRNEQLIDFSPNFTKLVDEEVNPLLDLIFEIDFMAGRFPPPPEEVLDLRDPEDVGLYTPEVEHQSKIALSLKNSQNVGFMQWKDRWADIIVLKPDILDSFDLDKQAREDWIGQGLSADNTLDEEVVAKIREQRAQMAAQQQQMEMAMQASQAAGNVMEKMTPEQAGEAVGAGA